MCRIHALNQCSQRLILVGMGVTRNHLYHDAYGHIRSERTCVVTHEERMLEPVKWRW